MKVWLKNIKFLPTAGNVRLNTLYCRKCESNSHIWNNAALRALIFCLKGQRVTAWKQHVCPKNRKESNSVVGGAEGDLLLPLPCHGHGSIHHLSPDIHKILLRRRWQSSYHWQPVMSTVPTSKEGTHGAASSPEAGNWLQHKRLRYIHLLLQCQGKIN